MLAVSCSLIRISMARSFGNRRCREAALPLQADAISCLLERQTENQKKEIRLPDYLSSCSTIYFAATEKKLVILSSVSRKGQKKSRQHPIHIRVQSQKEDDVVYLLDRSVPLKALMDDYCTRRGMHGTLRFDYDGAQVPENKSAEDLGMDDGDVIDAWADQFGG